MTRHEEIEKLNQQLNAENADLRLMLGQKISLTFIPGDGRKVGQRKPLPLKPGSPSSEDLIREARDSREDAL
jgi:hypothetical protein